MNINGPDVGKTAAVQTKISATLKSDAKFVPEPAKVARSEPTKRVRVEAQGPSNSQDAGLKLQISGKKGANAVKELHRLAQAMEMKKKQEDSPLDDKLQTAHLESNASASSQKLTPEEEAQVKELQRRDAEVKAHENAHLAAAGSSAQGGANYEFQVGPDGQAYAIGGQVQVAVTPGKTPEETVQKARVIRSSAMAPRDPSSQDVKVASEAESMEREALREITNRRKEAAGFVIEQPPEPKEDNEPIAYFKLIGSTYSQDEETESSTLAFA